MIAGNPRVVVSAKDAQLRFAPAREGWQQDVAWQVFGFQGEAQPPQFFYQIPDDEAEAKALIESISRSALVGRVQLLDARIEEATDREGEPTVADIRGAWEIQWQGMGRSAPWVEKADSAEVLESMMLVAGARRDAADEPVATTGAVSLDDFNAGEAHSGSRLVLGINVPLRDIERHAVGRGTIEAVR